MHLNMQHPCKGCVSFRPHRKNKCGDEAIPQISDIEQCPCMKCIVKTMCMNGCEDFHDYKRLCRKETGEIRYGWILMENECRGCHSYISNEQKVCDAGIIPYISETELCPCLNCIVKGMCEVTCVEFRKYAHQCFKCKEMEAC